MYLINELNCTDEEFKDKFRIVWNQIKFMNPFLEAEESPEGFVLGGQLNIPRWQDIASKYDVK